MQAGKRDAEGNAIDVAQRLASNNEASASDSNSPHALGRDLLATWVFFHPDCLDRVVALLNEWFPGCNGFKGDHRTDGCKGWWRLDLSVVAKLRDALGVGPNNQYYIRVRLSSTCMLNEWPMWDRKTVFGNCVCRFCSNTMVIAFQSLPDGLTR